MYTYYIDFDVISAYEGISVDVERECVFRATPVAIY